MNFKLKNQISGFKSFKPRIINFFSIFFLLSYFNLAQDRIENTLIRGGALQQGPWGEFVLKNILDSVGLRVGEEYST